MSKVIAATLAVGSVLMFPEKTEAHPGVPTTATAYCITGRMADGTWTRPRSAATLPGGLRLGTRIRLTGRPFLGGLRKFVVRDRIGYGSTLDLWAGDCGAAVAWGRRSITYKIGWGKP